MISTNAGADRRAHNRFMADALPDAELVILEGLKNAILIEAPDRVASHVRDFLLRHRDRT